MVEPKHHERVRVRQDPLVERLPVPRLVDPLEDGNRMSGGLADKLLKAERRAMEQLQRARDSLEKALLVPFAGLIVGPRYPANLGKGREAVVHPRRVAVHLQG